MLNAFRDWWRGFSNEDLAAALRKTERKPGTPGEIVWLSTREFKAWCAWTRDAPLYPAPRSH